MAGPHGITVCPVPGLMNICFGDPEGLSVDVAHGLFPVEHEAWMRDPWSARIASWLLPRRAFSQIRQDPSCLNVLVRRRSGWEIALLNDLSHLKLCSDD